MTLRLRVNKLPAHILALNPHILPAVPTPKDLLCKSFLVPGSPMGKPRMTRADRWRKRPCVLRYRAWSDHALACCPGLPERPLRVDLLAFLAMPKTWSTKKRALMSGTLHRQKPDYDNIAKSIDSLWEDDSCISAGYIEKRWADEHGPRLQIIVWYTD